MFRRGQAPWSSVPRLGRHGVWVRPGPVPAGATAGWDSRSSGVDLLVDPGPAQGALPMGRSDNMKAIADNGPDRGHSFRLRAVVVAGMIYSTIGIAGLVVGSSLVAWRGNRDALPLGLFISVVGLCLCLTGLGRVTARMEVTETCVAWTWAFSRHEVPFTELEDAALVEKGSPASGASWAGFLGGGFISSMVWWLVELVSDVVTSEPSLGAYDLVLIRHHGASSEVKPISAWSTRSSHSQANEALEVVRAAIASSPGRAPEGPRILRHDAWDPPKAS